MADDSLITLRGVTRRYGSLTAVDTLDLTVHRGETVALLGPNGAGKTTTIAMILGLLRPDTGEIRVAGRAPREAVRDGRVGAVLQEGGLMERVTVHELVGFVGGLYPDPLPVRDALASVGLEDVGGQRVDRLSGGQTRRVRVALAVVGDPALLVLDEPTASLDVQGRRQFWDTMHAYAAGGRSLVFATHHLEEADSAADRILMLSEGRLVADGPATEIKAAVGGRTVRFTCDGAGADDLERLSGVTSVVVRGDSVTLHTTDADATVRALLAQRPDVRDLEISGRDLEEAFVELTGSE